MKNLTNTVGSYLFSKLNAFGKTFSTGTVNYDSPENRVYKNFSREEGGMLLSEHKRTSGILNFDEGGEVLLF